MQNIFAECLLLTLGTEAPLPSVIFLHSVNHIFFHFWPLNFFCSPHTNTWYSMFQCDTFLGLFLYFFNLFHLIEFSWIFQIITTSHSNNKKMNGKMIFMLFSIVWGRIQDQTTNFEHLVHETWPRTRGRVIFKFYKKQTKSKNHETCQDVMISYVEAVIKIWEGFAQVVIYDAYHLVGLFTRS